MGVLVLLRHGQSEWNLQARFTGRYDCDLTELGRAEAVKAGIVLSKEGITFDAAHTSTLKRAHQTALGTLTHAGQKKITFILKRYDELCERDYGDLTGQFHAKATEVHGHDQVMRWRRKYEERPPGGESVKDVLDNRVGPYFERYLEPLIKAGNNVLVAAHNNSLRPLMIRLGVETPETIVRADLKTGTPIVFRFENGHIVDRKTLEIN